MIFFRISERITGMPQNLQKNPSRSWIFFFSSVVGIRSGIRWSFGSIGRGFSAAR
jgi:hypothetical protein